MAIGWTTAAIGLAGCGLDAPGSYVGWLMVSATGNGMAMSGTFAFSQTLAGPQAAGRWVGLQNGVGNLAGVIGPALTGFMVDWTGNFRAAIAVTALMSLLSAISYVFLVGTVKQVVWANQSATVVASAVPEIA
jgi:cyanate permease